jgi:hypothetical protein
VAVSKAEPDPACRLIGTVEGTDFDFLGPKYDAALEDLKAKAAERGANYVVIDNLRQPGTARIWVGGRAYRCGSDSERTHSSSQPLILGDR